MGKKFNLAADDFLDVDVFGKTKENESKDDEGKKPVPDTVMVGASLGLEANGSEVTSIRETCSSAKSVPQKKVERSEKITSYTKISLNLTNDLFELARIAAGIYYDGNMTKYISTLIERDIADRKEQYESIKKMLNK